MDTNTLKNQPKKRSNKNYYSSYPKLVAGSFLGLIAIGTFLLMLPISSKGAPASFLEALFTSTSASCVTGLVIADTFTKWTLFGQLVILALIQVGGLGFITIIAILSSFIRKRVSLREKLLLKESVGTIYTGDIKRLVRFILIGTIIFEAAGALILATQFIPMMNFKNGLYTSVFLSVSAFCNAGFDVLGRIEPGSSLMCVNDNPVIILTISMLVIIGGIGFIVWEDLATSRFKFKKLHFHAKITLTTTAILLFFGAILYFIFEYNNTLNDMSLWQKIYNAFFASVTPRTAGFNTLASDELSGASKMLTYVFMFIGGSSGSTAGGVKTATIAVLILCAISTLKSNNHINCFGRRITMSVLRKAISITIINLMLIIAATIGLTFFHPEMKYTDILFECISAIGTVGMSTGITASLTSGARIIIILLMFIGRITSLIFAFSLILDKNTNSVKKPKGSLLIG